MLKKLEEEKGIVVRFIVGRRYWIFIALLE
jgi:uncharacterized membrane protein